jgi:hypothetical protein
MASFRLGWWIHRCEAKKQQQSKQLQKEEKPQLKNLLEVQILLEVMDATLKRVEKMLFNDAN